MHSFKCTQMRARVEKWTSCAGTSRKQLPKVFYYTGKQTNHIISTEHIMYDLMNITLVYLPRKSTHNGSCKFNGIQKVFFSSTIYINVIPR